MSVLYGKSEFDALISKNASKHLEFLSGERWLGLQKLFRDKGRSKKLLIPIGLHVLTLKTIEKRKTRTGGVMMVLKFVIPSKESWFNNDTLRYHSIDCYHIFKPGRKEKFHKMFFLPFTACFLEEDFVPLSKGMQFKAVVKHVEEPFIKDGQPVLYERGDSIGKTIVLIKPEIERIYKIDTSDKEIDVNYFKLYKPYKR